MDKYLTYPGKQPVYLGDIDFMQSAVAGALLNLLKGYTGQDSPTAILYGVEVSIGLNSVSWTAGVVCLDGEILPVEAGVISGTTGYFDIISATDGARTFGDGQSHDCFEVRSAAIVPTVTSWPVAGTPRLNPVDMFEARVYEFEGISNVADSYARISDVGGALHLDIRRPAMEETGTIAFQALILLPEAWRNKLASDVNPSSMLAVVSIDPNGEPINSFTVRVAWDANPDIGRGRTKITVTLPSNVTQITAPFEVHCIIPVFS